MCTRCKGSGVLGLYVYCDCPIGKKREADEYYGYGPKARKK